MVQRRETQRLQGRRSGSPFPSPREEETEAWGRGLLGWMVGAKKASVALEMSSRHVVVY